MRLPSGDQAGWPSESNCLPLKVTRASDRAGPPAAGITSSVLTILRAFWSKWANASDRPSGDQAGFASPVLALRRVSACAPLPSAAITNSCAASLSCDRLVTRVNAIADPSGDQRGKKSPASLTSLAVARAGPLS
jgi:hypothetical protein